MPMATLSTEELGTISNITSRGIALEISPFGGLGLCHFHLTWEQPILRPGFCPRVQPRQIYRHFHPRLNHLHYFRSNIIRNTADSLRKIKDHIFELRQKILSAMDAVSKTKLKNNWPEHELHVRCSSYSFVLSDWWIRTITRFSGASVHDIWWSSSELSSYIPCTWGFPILLQKQNLSSFSSNYRHAHISVVFHLKK